MIKKLIKIFACSALLFGSHVLRGMDAAPAPTTSSALVKIKAPGGKEIQVSEQFINSCQTLKDSKQDITGSDGIIDMSASTGKGVSAESLLALNLLCLVPNKEANLAHIKKQEYDVLKKLEQAAKYLGCDKTSLNPLEAAAQNPIRKSPATDKTLSNRSSNSSKLDLSNCQLEALTGIEHRFSMSYLTKVDISNNYLGTINLGKLLALSPQLKKLFASNCQTEKLKLDRKLPDGFELDVSHNELTDKVVLPLLHLLNREGCLVNLTGNRLSDDAITKIKKALGPTFLQRRRNDFDNFAIKYTHNLFFPLAHTAIYLGGALGIGAYYAYNSMSVKSFTFYFVSGGHGLVQTSSLIGLLFWGKYSFINPIKPPIIITKSQKK